MSFTLKVKDQIILSYVVKKAFAKGSPLFFIITVRFKTNTTDKVV